jgi:pimeloyl-ACP methyl ester carboxylesterase
MCPDRVRSLALYEPVAFGILGAGEDEGAPARALPAYHADASGLDEAWLSTFVDWWNGPGTWAALAEPTKAGFRAVGWKVSQEVASVVGDATDRARYATITVPTLVLTGTRSPLSEQLVCRRLAEALPRARLQTFADMGHMAPITNADAVNAAIAAHLLELRSLE